MRISPHKVAVHIGKYDTALFTKYSIKELKQILIKNDGDFNKTSRHVKINEASLAAIIGVHAPGLRYAIERRKAEYRVNFANVIKEALPIEIKNQIKDVFKNTSSMLEVARVLRIPIGIIQSVLINEFAGTECMRRIKVVVRWFKKNLNKDIEAQLLLQRRLSQYM